MDFTHSNLSPGTDFLGGGGGAPRLFIVTELLSGLSRLTDLTGRCINFIFDDHHVFD